MKRVKGISIKNGYPLDLIKRVIKSHDNNLNKPQIYGPEKFPAVLKLPYIGEISHVFENKVKDLTKTTYNEVSPRTIFISQPLLKKQLKDPIPNLNKSCVVYKFNCFCERSYISQTLRHFKTRLKEYLPACVLKFIEKKIMKLRQR